MNKHKDLYLQPFVSFEPSVCEEQINEDIHFLIVACDGVWDVFSDEEACVIVANTLKCCNNDPKKAASVLRDQAFLSGSTDNISVAICIINQWKKQK